MISDEIKLAVTSRTILLIIYYVFSLILFVQVKNITMRNRKTTWSCKEVAIFSGYLGWRDTFKYGRKDRLWENFSDWKQQHSVTWKKFVLDNNTPYTCKKQQTQKDQQSWWRRNYKINTLFSPRKKQKTAVQITQIVSGKVS